MLPSRLGNTSRHLRRAFDEESGVTSVQYLQTCRLLLAKFLLADTRRREQVCGTRRRCIRSVSAREQLELMERAKGIGP